MAKLQHIHRGPRTRPAERLNDGLVMFVSLLSQRFELLKWQQSLSDEREKSFHFLIIRLSRFWSQTHKMTFRCSRLYSKKNRRTNASWSEHSGRGVRMVFVRKVNIWLRHFNTSTPISREFIWFLGKFRSSSLRPVITLNDREILRESSARDFEVLIATALENWITNRYGEVFFWWSSSSAYINPSSERWPYQLYTISFMSKLRDWIKAETIMLDLSREENWCGNWKSSALLH